METWNREELYREVWDQPLVKLAPKYGISAVALGKVCHKLQIPLPGRGYWIKKEFGKPVEQLPLPEAKNLPIVQLFKFPAPQEAASAPSSAPPEVPTDPEYLRIVAFESRDVALNTNLKWHPLVKESDRILRRASVDVRGILEPPAYGEQCLDLRVSKQSLKRALDFLNAVILALEAEGFPVSIERGKHETGVKIFGHRVRFAISGTQIAKPVHTMVFGLVYLPLLSRSLDCQLTASTAKSQRHPELKARHQLRNGCTESSSKQIQIANADFFSSVFKV